MSEVRGGGWEELPQAPTPEATGGSLEDQPHTRDQGRRPGGQHNVQGAVAAWAQECLENLSHVEGQEGRQ